MDLIQHIDYGIQKRSIVVRVTDEDEDLMIHSSLESPWSGTLLHTALAKEPKVTARHGHEVTLQLPAKPSLHGLTTLVANNTTYTQPCLC